MNRIRKAGGTHPTWMLSCFQSVSSSDITAIIDKHNELRSDPKTTETATAMCKVVCSLLFLFHLLNLTGLDLICLTYINILCKIFQSKWLKCFTLNNMVKALQILTNLHHSLIYFILVLGSKHRKDRSALRWRLSRRARQTKGRPGWVSGDQ